MRSRASRRTSRTRNVLSLDDPDIFKYPVIYLIEPSWWDMTETDAIGLRQYLDKGGFVIVDDFKTESGEAVAAGRSSRTTWSV